jgi:hypothetical protein
MLAKQAFYCLSNPTRPFFSGYVGDGVLRSIAWYDRHEPPHHILVEMGSREVFVLIAHNPPHLSIPSS